MKAIVAFILCGSLLAGSAGADERSGKNDPAPASAAANGEEVAGVGAALSLKEGGFYVEQVTPNSPAATSQLLRKGDRILAVADGERAAQEVAGHTMTEVVAMIRGKAGSQVRLTILHAGENGASAREILLTRRKLGLQNGLTIFVGGHTFEPGSKAPELPYLRLSDGQRGALGTSHRGKIVVLKFWATWCAPCQQAMEAFQKIAVSFSNQKDKIDFLSISIDHAESASDIPAVIEKVGAHVKQKVWTETINGWSTREERKAWGVDGVPATYIIDAEGKFVIGNPEQSFEDAIAPLLAR
jgi:thiol-disulfide isomerase/thioredoxin